MPVVMQARTVIKRTTETLKPPPFGEARRVWWWGCLSLCFGFPFLSLSPLLAYEPFPPPHPASPATTVGAEIRVELLPRQQTTLSSEMAARITRIMPREGHRFRKGDLLVTFDCAMEEAQMRRATAILDAAKAKSQVSRRLSNLQATSKLEDRVAQADVAKAEAELAIIQVKINRCRITAPFSGRVVAWLSQEHQYVKAGEPLMEILDAHHLEVVFLLPSRRQRQLAIGTSFQIYLDETQRDYPARIVAFGAMIDAISQSVKVFGVVDGEFSDLLPGMSGIARFLFSDTPAPTSHPSNVLTAP